ASASSRMRSISSGFNASTSTGSYDLLGADISSRASDLSPSCHWEVPPGLMVPATGSCTTWRGDTKVPRVESNGAGMGECARGPPGVLARAARQVAGEGRGPHGQRKSEPGTAGAGPPDRDGAAVGLDDALDDVQPESGAAALAAPPEAGEDAVHGVLRDAGALVAHRDRRGRVLAVLRFSRGRRGREVDGDSSLAVAHGIFQQVAQHLVDLVRVRPQVGQRVLDAQ